MSVSLIGGRARCLRRHLERRGAQNMDDLVRHFVHGAHGWYPEDLDRALAELIEFGFAAPADSHGFYRLMGGAR